jgi:hypothetical protein
VKTTAKALLFAILSGITLFGSTISSSNLSSSTGTIGTYNFSTFDTTSTNMGGLLVDVTYASGATATCTWTNGVNGCSSAGNFSITETNGANGTFNGTWNFTDSKTGTSVTAITFIGSGPGNTSGLVGFDLCWNSNNTPNYANTGGTTTSCGVEGTVGSNIGWSAGTVTGGKAVSPTSVVYTNAVKLPTASVPVGDEFSKVTFNFASGSFTNSATAFTWRMDTDSLQSAVPEPATLGMVGFALLGLGGLRRRRNRQRS